MPTPPNDGDGYIPNAPPKPRRLMRDWHVWLGLVVSLFFLYWAFRQVDDLGNIARSLRHANYLYMVPALMIYFVGVAVRAERWRLLLQPMKTLATRRLFPIVVIGYMANDILPARMGEFVRAYVLGRDEGVSEGSSLATIFVERVFDGLTMLLFVAVAALLVPLDPRLDSIIRVAGGAMAVLMVATILMAARPLAALHLISLLFPLAPVAVRPKLAVLADRFVLGLSVLQSIPATLAVLGLSVLAWLCEATMYYLVGFAFAIGLGFPPFLLTTAVANLATMVPSSPGYVGTFEAPAVFTLKSLGVDGDLAMSYTVALHAALLVPITLLGFYYLWRRHISLSVSRGEV